VDPLAVSHPADDGSAPGEAAFARMQGPFVRAAAAGDVLFEPGEPGDPFLVVQAGEVALLGPECAGQRRLLARFGPGDSVGEIDALLGRPRTAQAVAVTDCRLLQLDRETFREMCLARPEIALRIVERLAKHGADLERRLGVLGMDDLVRPIVRSLLRELPSGSATNAKAAPNARLTTSLRAIAESAGLSLRDAHRGLNELFDRKLVRLVEDVLIVPDPRALGGCLDDDAEATGSGLSR
jgi:CRP/FNR family transcriptional regulator